MNDIHPLSIHLDHQYIIESMKNGEVPNMFPYVSPIDSFEDRDISIELKLKQSLQSIMLKDEINKLGMWGYISQNGAQWLVERFPGKTWLDPFSGRGWLAKALRDAGAVVIAGDIDPNNPVTDVITSDAFDLVEKYKDQADILLISWTYDDSDVDYKAALSFGKDKDIILYGHTGVCFSSALVNSLSFEEDLSEHPDMIARPMERQVMVRCKIGN